MLDRGLLQYNCCLGNARIRHVHWQCLLKILRELVDAVLEEVRAIEVGSKGEIVITSGNDVLPGLSHTHGGARG